MRYIASVLTATLLIVTLLACGTSNPHVIIKTQLGEIEIELYVDKAPITANNFLRYVDNNKFTGATFYRVVRQDNQQDSKVKIEVIQGGLDIDDGVYPPIAHETTEETGVLHEDGTISMARWGPGTATQEFFICVGPQPELDFGGDRNGDGQGFAAFGKVVRGIEVVREIHLQPVDGQRLDPKINITEIIRSKE